MIADFVNNNYIHIPFSMLRYFNLNFSLNKNFKVFKQSSAGLFFFCFFTYSILRSDSHAFPCKIPPWNSMEYFPWNSMEY